MAVRVPCALEGRGCTIGNPYVALNAEVEAGLRNPNTVSTVNRIGCGTATAVTRVVVDVVLVDVVVVVEPGGVGL